MVDEVLRARSPFGEMDFATRDRYRHAIEVLARGSRLTEIEVATRAVSMADDDTPSADDSGSNDVDRTAADHAETAAPEGPAHHPDPGYYLISDGRL